MTSEISDDSPRSVPTEPDSPCPAITHFLNQNRRFRNASQKNIRNSDLVFLSVALLGSMLTGCSPTAAPGPSVIQRVEGEKPAAPPSTGFLGSDYSLLRTGAPGSGQEAMLAYTNPAANFASYTKIMIAPVTYWADDDSKLSPDQQQLLCNYFLQPIDGDLRQEFHRRPGSRSGRGQINGCPHRRELGDAGPAHDLGSRTSYPPPQHDQKRADRNLRLCRIGNR